MYPSLVWDVKKQTDFVSIRPLLIWVRCTFWKLFMLHTYRDCSACNGSSNKMCASHRVSRKCHTHAHARTHTVFHSVNINLCLLLVDSQPSLFSRHTRPSTNCWPVATARIHIPLSWAMGERVIGGWAPSGPFPVFCGAMVEPAEQQADSDIHLILHWLDTFQIYKGPTRSL